MRGLRRPPAQRLRDALGVAPAVRPRPGARRRADGDSLRGLRDGARVRGARRLPAVRQRLLCADRRHGRYAGDATAAASALRPKGRLEALPRRRIGDVPPGAARAERFRRPPQHPPAARVLPGRRRRRGGRAHPGALRRRRRLRAVRREPRVLHAGGVRYPADSAGAAGPPAPRPARRRAPGREAREPPAVWRLPGLPSRAAAQARRFRLGYGRPLGLSLARGAPRGCRVIVVRSAGVEPACCRRQLAAGRGSPTRAQRHVERRGHHLPLARRPLALQQRPSDLRPRRAGGGGHQDGRSRPAEHRGAPLAEALSRGAQLHHCTRTA
mmetsp:Transcript_10543/g.30111  ORF Transcript_10543/g.30111 Transcript_10543/m.30111 type:complete len:326 (-) Transcript_10543:200-1177(-)